MVKAPFREARRLSADVDRMCAIALLLPHNRRFSTRPCALPPDLRVSDIPVGPCICFFVRSAFVLFTSSRPWFDLYIPVVSRLDLGPCHVVHRAPLVDVLRHCYRVSAAPSPKASESTEPS